MFCEKCGKEIKPNSKFCIFCGAIAGHEKNYDSKMENKPKKLNGLTKSIIVGGVFFTIFLIIYYFTTTIQTNQKAREQEQYDIKNIACTRKEPYEMPEEFKRAFSIIKQRWTDYGFSGGSDYIDSYKNCFNIQYGDLRMVGGAEGAFWFDETISSPDNLQITIDNIYKFNDDLLTAVILQHEIVHALNFISDKRDGVKTDCIESEIKAFTAESAFLRTLNQGEKDSIIQRYISLQEGTGLNEYSENFFSSLQAIFIAQEHSLEVCSEQVNNGMIEKRNINACRLKIEYATIKKILEENKYCE